MINLKNRIFIVLFCLLLVSKLGYLCAETIGDVNNDGKVDLNEAIHALRVVADIITENVSVNDLKTNIYMHERFVSTSQKIDATTSNDGVANAACMNEFGDDYRVASWTDIQNYFSSANDLQKLEFFINLGMKRIIEGIGTHGLLLRSYYLVSYNGKEIRTGTNHYFCARHDGITPSYFGFDSHIDNHTIDLGNYAISTHALCFKK